MEQYVEESSQEICERVALQEGRAVQQSLSKAESSSKRSEQLQKLRSAKPGPDVHSELRGRRQHSAALTQELEDMDQELRAAVQDIALAARLFGETLKKPAVSRISLQASRKTVEARLRESSVRMKRVRAELRQMKLLTKQLQASLAKLEKRVSYNNSLLLEGILKQCKSVPTIRSGKLLIPSSRC